MRPNKDMEQDESVYRVYPALAEKAEHDRSGKGDRCSESQDRDNV
jgi:hypothetical protein